MKNFKGTFKYIRFVVHFKRILSCRISIKYIHKEGVFNEDVQNIRIFIVKKIILFFI